MRTFALLVVVSLGFLQGEAGKEADTTRIAGLIKQLGDEKFTRRQAASKELESLGETAVAALRQAAASSDDIEIRRRAETLIALIEDQIARTDVKSAPPPKGAISLFNGKDIDAWVHRDGQTDPVWRVLDGKVMEATGGDIRTRQTFSEGYRLHVEFRVPHLPAGDDNSGNSGVYLHGRYEVQILDSHGKQADDRICGALYRLAAPRINVSKKPGVWQSYDIEFRPHRFKDGAWVEAGRVTVFHNGTLIHDKVELPLVPLGDGGLEGEASEAMPILLQYHGSPVQFRNLWLR